MASRLEAALKRPPASPAPGAAPGNAGTRSTHRSGGCRHAACPARSAQGGAGCAGCNSSDRRSDARAGGPLSAAADKARHAGQPVRQHRGRDGQSARPSGRETFLTRPTACCVRLLTGAAVLVTLTQTALAQDISINFGQGAGLTERVIQLVALITVLSLAPSILVMMTSFTRIVVVLSLLRTALGTGTAPPNAVIVALALFLTAFVMGPAFQNAYDVGIKPLRE